MNKETTNILKKTIKITGVTCVALGGAALIASGAALKAVTEGAKYLKDTIEKIVKYEPDVEETIVEAAAEETDFAEPEVQNVAAAEDQV